MAADREPVRSVLEAGLATLRREGYEPIVAGVPLCAPDYIVALCVDRRGDGYEVLYADEEGVTEHSWGEEICGMYGDVVALLFVEARGPTAQGDGDPGGG